MATTAAVGRIEVPYGDEVKPYHVHISGRYLELQKKKLELTRFPHEGAKPRSKDWWEPKPEVEPLIDHWIERYSWRAQETILNKTPQFRTAFSIPRVETPLRMHFIHVLSPHENAIPLLLLPPFPLTNLSFTGIVSHFTEPEKHRPTADSTEGTGGDRQPFHVVIPALPGLGFSDALPNNTPVVSTTAGILDSLMARLGYSQYLASNLGSGQSSPAEIDWKLMDQLATHYSSSCLGAHFISPPLTPPKLLEAPLSWAKWSVAKLLGRPMLGYDSNDFRALRRAAHNIPKAAAKEPHEAKAAPKLPLDFNRYKLTQPNTLAYGLCDSPTGLLLFVLEYLRLLGSSFQLTQDQILTFAELAWLPGPEYAMRMWAHCALHADKSTASATTTATNNDGSRNNNDAQQSPNNSKRSTPRVRPRVSITVFLGDETDDAEEPRDAIMLEHRRAIIDGYACPAWGDAQYNILSTQKIPGRAGLLALERPEVIATGIGNLAKKLILIDDHFRPSATPSTAPLDSVVNISEPATVPGQRPGASLAPGDASGGLEVPERPQLEQGDSSQTAVASLPRSSFQDRSAEEFRDKDKDKGRVQEEAMPSPATPAPIVQRKASLDEADELLEPGTPDTVIMRNTPPR